jgi:hypothetical protein
LSFPSAFCLQTVAPNILSVSPLLSVCVVLCLKKKSLAGEVAHASNISYSAEMGRIAVQVQPGQKGHKSPSQ